MSRSCAYSCIDPAQNERFGVHGIPERKEYDDNLRAVCAPEVQVWEPTLLESGLLCEYCDIMLWTLFVWVNCSLNLSQRRTLSYGQVDCTGGIKK